MHIDRVTVVDRARFLVECQVASGLGQRPDRVRPVELHMDFQRKD